MALLELRLLEQTELGQMRFSERDAIPAIAPERRVDCEVA
jgi:hypothetical protein